MSKNKACPYQHCGNKKKALEISPNVPVYAFKESASLPYSICSLKEKKCFVLIKMFMGCF